MKKIYLSIAAITTTITAIGNVNAMTATADLSVSATITATCTASTTAVDFGAVASGSGAVTTGTVGVNCTTGTAYTVALNEGLSHDGTDRRITDGTNFITYTLDESATPWGDNTLNGLDRAGTGTGAAQTYTVDASLAATAVPAGVYSDTVVVTVTY